MMDGVAANVASIYGVASSPSVLLFLFVLLALFWSAEYEYMLSTC